MFDRADTESLWLSFVAQEFRKRGTELRWRMSRKHYAYQHVAALGLRVAQKYAVLKDVADLRAEDLGERVVLKYGLGWSARGVMLLTRLDDGSYLEHMSLKTMTLAEVVAEQQQIAKRYAHAEPFWLLEEFLQPLLGVGAVPFDYKFYVFGDRIGFIAQNDYNASPSKIALFDGNFMPLVNGINYSVTRPDLVEMGVPILPLHAAELAWWALCLAREVDAPFVRVDLYDTPEGPVFGEFTFSPGNIYKRRFVFSQELLDYFDHLFLRAIPYIQDRFFKDKSIPGVSDTLKHKVASKLAKLEDDTAHLESLVSLATTIHACQTAKMPLEMYRALAGGVYNNHLLGADRTSEWYSRAQNRARTDLERDLLAHFSAVWLQIGRQQKAYRDSRE